MGRRLEHCQTACMMDPETPVGSILMESASTSIAILEGNARVRVLARTVLLQSVRRCCSLMDDGRIRLVYCQVLEGKALYLRYILLELVVAGAHVYTRSVSEVKDLQRNGIVYMNP